MAVDAENVGGRADTTPTETTYDVRALSSKLESKMDDAFGGDDFGDEVVDDDSEVIDQEVDTDEEDDSQADQEDTESEDEDEVVEDDADSEDEDTVEEAADEPVTKKGKSPTLPDSYRRSLAAHGWKPEEIDQNLELLGPKFVDMAAGVHAKRTAEIAQWAEVGRKAAEAAASPQSKDGQGGDGLPDKLSPVNYKALAEQYGDSELLEHIFTPINDTINKLNEILPKVHQGVESIQQTHIEAANQQIHSFFDHEKMAPYRKFYGGSEHERTAEQLEHRIEVANKASYIMAGARAMHREITLEQALTEAHDATASTFREQAVRKSIKKEVKKRNRGISQRPTKRGTSVSSSRPKTASERERKIGALMKSAFGN